METAVQAPAAYSSAGDSRIDQAGPSGLVAKKDVRKPQTDGQQPNRYQKRRGSFGNAHDKNKRRRRNDIALPTKFMLGGNIRDPLNLKSLENEEVNRLANRTPVASPAPRAGGSSERVEVIIPKNINDPLNLNGPEAPVDSALAAKRNRRRRRNNRRRLEEESQNVEVSNRGPDGNAKKSNKSNQRFRYGNYNRYYGYRNGCGNDNRLSLMKKKWFSNKVCLDIGCNVGHITLSVARDHQPKQMVGLDIDPELVKIAKKNVRHYVHQQDTAGQWFPVSCAMTFGPIALSGAQTGFPHNIFFISGNYVLENDDLISTQKEEFDTIMCLSTTKWMQLNFGDDGLKRVFHRVFRQLRPGGRFILEPQPLSSYHKFVSPEHRENYRKMVLKPDDYPTFLTDEVGFASYKVLGIGSHGAKGFQRPLYLFRKAKAPEDGTEKPKPSPAHECDTTTASI